MPIAVCSAISSSSGATPLRRPAPKPYSCPGAVLEPASPSDCKLRDDGPQATHTPCDHVEMGCGADIHNQTQPCSAPDRNSKWNQNAMLEVALQSRKTVTDVADGVPWPFRKRTAVRQIPNFRNAPPSSIFLHPANRSTDSNKMLIALSTDRRRPRLVEMPSPWLTQNSS